MPFTTNTPWLLLFVGSLECSNELVKLFSRNDNDVLSSSDIYLPIRFRQPYAQRTTDTAKYPLISVEINWLVGAIGT